MVGKAYLAAPPVTEAAMNAWLLDLVEKIEMKVLMGPYSINCDTLGNEGVTGTIVIETSHCAGHCWHMVERPFMMFDVYSCVEFDSQTVLRNMHEHFNIVSCDYAVLDRNETISIVESDTWRP